MCHPKNWANVVTARCRRWQAFFTWPHLPRFYDVSQYEKLRAQVEGQLQGKARVLKVPQICGCRPTNGGPTRLLCTCVPRYLGTPISRDAWRGRSLHLSPRLIKTGLKD